MGHYFLQITEVADDKNIVHAKIDMNLFVRGDPIVAFGQETPRQGIHLTAKISTSFQTPSW